MSKMVPEAPDDMDHKLLTMLVWKLFGVGKTVELNMEDMKKFHETFPNAENDEATLIIRHRKDAVEFTVLHLEGAKRYAELFREAGKGVVIE